MSVYDYIQNYGWPNHTRLASFRTWNQYSIRCVFQQRRLRWIESLIPMVAIAQRIPVNACELIHGVCQQYWPCFGCSFARHQTNDYCRWLSASHRTIAHSNTDHIAHVALSYIHWSSSLSSSSFAYSTSSFSTSSCTARVRAGVNSTSYKTSSHKETTRSAVTHTFFSNIEQTSALRMHFITFAA